MIYILSFLLVICSVAIGVLSWYIREIIKQFSEVESQIEKMVTNISAYEEHLDAVYSMDTFFGEPVLSSLLEHTKDLKKDLEFVRNNFRLYEDEQ